MKPEQQRIAIAEACGWKLEWRTINGKRARRAVKQVHMLVFQQETFPDYLNDLNAMHEAEKVLDSNQQITFACYLTEPVRGEIYEVMPGDKHYQVCFPALHATAAQRAEAFLRTLNLWTS